MSSSFHGIKTQGSLTVKGQHTAGCAEDPEKLRIEDRIQQMWVRGRESWLSER